MLFRWRFYCANDFETSVVFVGKADQLPTDAANAYQRFTEAGGTTLASIPDNCKTRPWSLIIDGLFGIGLKRDISAPYAGLIECANALAARDKCPLLALDCPSGLNTDTGVIHGATIRASQTISFIGAKPGLFTADGPDHCGQVTIASLGLASESAPEKPGRTIGLDLFSARLRPRLLNSHKGLPVTQGSSAALLAWVARHFSPLEQRYSWVAVVFISAWSTDNPLLSISSNQN